MKRTSILAALAVAVGLSACGTERPGAPVSTAKAPTVVPAVVPGRLLVKVADEAVARRAAAAVGATRVAALSALGVIALQVPPERAAAARERLASLPGVSYAEFDGVASVLVKPDGKGKPKPTPEPEPSAEPEPISEVDPYLESHQWGLERVEAAAAWRVTTGSDQVRIAVLDTGIDQNHEDLDPDNARNGGAGKIVADADFTGSSSGADDAYGHGTHCAGIAAAATANGVGVAGLGHDTVLLNGKVLNDRGSGSYLSIAQGIEWAIDNQADVISLSLGGTQGSETLRSAVELAASRGIVVVAAAGNSGASAALYPARYDVCIAVAATDEQDRKASFSNYGVDVDVAAPGVNIFSTLPNHRNRIGGRDYGSLNGTSMATPFVAGLAALIKAQNPSWSAAAVRERLEGTCDAIAGTGTYWTHGRINAARAVGATL